MADDTEDDVLELAEDQEIEEQQDEDRIDESDEGDEPEDGENETVIGFGDDDEAAPASGDGDTPLIKHLRAELRETKKRLAELSKSASPQLIDLGPKPTLESCDYDEERFEQELDAWKWRKAEADKAQTEAQRQQEQVEQLWRQRLQAYDGERRKLPFADAEEAGETVEAVIGLDRRKALIRVADNPAQLEYALAKSPQRLEAISRISDPVELIKAFVKMEGALRVSTRKKAPAPEKIARGNASVSARAKDKELERLEKEAERTGDRTALIEYRRKLKSKA